MKLIGIMAGQENSFPEALIEEINSRKLNTVCAERVFIDSVTLKNTMPYDVIFDRVSCEVQFFNSLLKYAHALGVRIVNNPFSTYRNDSFSNLAIADCLGIRVPRTALLPSKDQPYGTTPDTFRNLAFPLNWESIFEYVKFPAYIKPDSDNPFINSFKVYNQAEFFAAYDLTGQHVMLLQESIDYQEYYRCYVIGDSEPVILHYNPSKPLHLRFCAEIKPSDEVRAKMIDASLKISSSIGLEFNSVEFAVLGSDVFLTESYNNLATVDSSIFCDDDFKTIVKNTADYLIKVAKAIRSKSHAPSKTVKTVAVTNSKAEK